MNVSLTPELEKFIQRKLKSGRYHTASEVIREGLRLLEEQDQLRALKIEALHKEIKVGIDQADRGEVEPLDVRGTLDKVRKQSAARRKAKA